MGRGWPRELPYVSSPGQGWGTQAPPHLLRELNIQQSSGEAENWDPGELMDKVGGSPGRLPGGKGLTQWPPGFPQDTGPRLVLPLPSGFPRCAHHTPLSSAGPSVAGPGPAQQLPHPRADSRTACRVGRGPKVSGRRGETRWQVGRAGGIAPPVWVPDGVLCAFPEDSTGHSRLLPTPPTPFLSWSSHGNPDSLGAGCPEGSGHVTMETTGSELPPCTCLPPNFAIPMHHHLTFFFKSVLYPLFYSL